MTETDLIDDVKAAFAAEARTAPSAAPSTARDYHPRVGLGPMTTATGAGAAVAAIALATTLLPAPRPPGPSAARSPAAATTTVTVRAVPSPVTVATPAGTPTICLIMASASGPLRAGDEICMLPVAAGDTTLTLELVRHGRVIRSRAVPIDQVQTRTIGVGISFNVATLLRLLGY